MKNEGKGSVESIESDDMAFRGTYFKSLARLSRPHYSLVCMDLRCPSSIVYVSVFEPSALGHAWVAMFHGIFLSEKNRK
jgi:hypothetical protein